MNIMMFCCFGCSFSSKIPNEFYFSVHVFELKIKGKFLVHLKKLNRYESFICLTFCRNFCVFSTIYIRTSESFGKFACKMFATRISQQAQSTFVKRNGVVISKS